MGWLLSMVIIGIAIGSNSTFSKINFFHPPIRFYGAESLSVSIPRNIHFGANQKREKTSCLKQSYFFKTKTYQYSDVIEV